MTERVNALDGCVGLLTAVLVSVIIVGTALLIWWLP